MGRRLKNYQLLPVPEQQRQAVQAKYRQVREYTGDSVECVRCQRPTTRPSGWCSWCANRCSHPTSLAAYIVVGNGASQPKEFCFDCGRIWGVTKGSIILDVELENRVSDSEDTQPCSRCGRRVGTELHHWAPRAIFADADWWPQDHLCVSCHRTWHYAMRAAGGYRLDNLQHIDGFGGAA